MPHVAAIAADRDGVVYRGAVGPRAAGESDPVTVDTLFRIMSMTKMPRTVAALQQVERAISTWTRRSRGLPGVADVQVLADSTDTPRLRAPDRPATVRT